MTPATQSYDGEEFEPPPFISKFANTLGIKMDANKAVVTYGHAITLAVIELCEAHATYRNEARMVTRL